MSFQKSDVPLTVEALEDLLGQPVPPSLKEVAEEIRTLEEYVELEGSGKAFIDFSKRELTGCLKDLIALPKGSKESAKRTILRRAASDIQIRHDSKDGQLSDDEKTVLSNHLSDITEAVGLDPGEAFEGIGWLEE